MKPHTVLIAIFLISCALIIAGCSTQVTTPSTNEATGGATSPTLKTVDINNTNKSIVEQHQATVAALIPDGTYAKDVEYYSPAGLDAMAVSVTIKDDVVTAISLKGNSQNPMSERYINAVNAALPGLVVGKRIDQINIPRQVSGSSLTSAAVKQYLAGLIQK